MSKFACAMPKSYSEFAGTSNTLNPSEQFVGCKPGQWHQQGNGCDSAQIKCFYDLMHAAYVWILKTKLHRYTAHETVTKYKNDFIWRAITSNWWMGMHRYMMTRTLKQLNKSECFTYGHIPWAIIHVITYKHYPKFPALKRLQIRCF